jgi:hypothetical protein
VLKILEGLLEAPRSSRPGVCPRFSAAFFVNRGSVLCLNRSLGVSAIERGNQPACWGSGSIRGRVASGDCSPEAPTDPDMRIFRIRLLGPRLRYVAGEWM